jgi:uncharacterized protein (DUF1810 family)
MMDRETRALQRFVEAQDTVYQDVLLELRAGRKRSHWMWFIFPQIEGLGSSAMAQRYAIASGAEAQAYLRHPVLRERLVQCTLLMLEHTEKTPNEILGSPDDLKFFSCMTLFDTVSEKGSPFKQALDVFFDGQRDEKTLALLAA